MKAFSRRLSFIAFVTSRITLHSYNEHPFSCSENSFPLTLSCSVRTAILDTLVNFLLSPCRRVCIGVGNTVHLRAAMFAENITAEQRFAARGICNIAFFRHFICSLSHYPLRFIILFFRYYSYRLVYGRPFSAAFEYSEIHLVSQDSVYGMRLKLCAGVSFYPSPVHFFA